MLRKVIININEQIVTDDENHSGRAEARPMRRGCQMAPAAALSGSAMVGGGQGST